MRFLILGSSSLLGSALCEELASRGHDITVLAPDPRRISEDWKLRFRCHYGEIGNAHVLHAALEDADRVLFAPSQPRHPSLAEEEPRQTQTLLEANAQAGIARPILKLTSWGSVYESPWWAMASRRKADQLTRLDPNAHLFAVGWIGELLLRFLHRGIFWIPEGFDAQVLWLSRAETVRRLCDLFLQPVPPRFQEIVGSVRMTVAEAAAHVVSRSQSGATGLVRAPGARALVRASRWLPWSFQGLERVVWGCVADDPAPQELPWVGKEDPFLELLARIDPP